MRGRYTRMRPCRQCHGNGSHESQPHPSNKGLQTAWPEKSERFREIFSHSKVVLPAVPATFFFHKKFSHIFSLCCQRVFARFFTIFRTFFRTIFRTVFLRIFRTSLLRILLTHFFMAVCCPKGFRSLQSQHCVTVAETGHTRHS